MNIDELLGSGTATTSEETVSATTIPEEKAEVLPVDKETKPKKKKGFMDKIKESLDDI